MDLTQEGERQPLRLWPGVVAVVVQWFFWFGVPIGIVTARTGTRVDQAVSKTTEISWIYSE